MMNFAKQIERIEQEQLRQQLYEMFRIYQEDYLTTLKLTYIYRWVEKRAGGDAIHVTYVLYKDWPGRRKRQKIDEMFSAMQTVELRPLAASPNERPPISDRLVGIQKW